MRSNISVLPEGELVNLVKQRSLKGFEILYDKYAPALYGIILTATTDKQLAITILQAAFSKIWESYDSYNPCKMRLFTWVYNVTRFVANDYDVALTDSVYKRLNYETCKKNNSV